MIAWLKSVDRGLVECLITEREMQQSFSPSANKAVDVQTLVRKLRTSVRDSRTIDRLA
jgi:hypothetical protein